MQRMKPGFSLRGLALAVAICTVASAAPVEAQTADAIQRLTIVVPYAETGPTAKLARALAPQFGRALGRDVSLAFRGGAGGTLATAEVAASRDTSGNTLLLHNTGMASAPTLYRHLSYDPQRDFVPIGRAGDGPMVLLTRAGIEPRSARELWSYIRSNKDTLALAYGGAGSAGQLCGLLLERVLGVRLFWVPFTGTGPALQDLVAGRSDLLCDQTIHTLDPIRDGRVRAFVVTDGQRIAVQPDIPTSAEGGLADLQVTVWHGLFAPKGTPASVVTKLSEALKSAVTSPEYIAQMRAVGVNPATALEATPNALSRLLASEIARWKPLIVASGQFAD